MSYVYILFSETLQKFYIGSTGDLPEGRLQKHLKSNKGFTAQVKDWKIVYTETISDISSAREREYQLKSWKSAKRIAEPFNAAQWNRSSRPTGREGFRFES